MALLLLASSQCCCYVAACHQAGHTHGPVTVSGNISVNGEPLVGDKMQQISGFVHQEDVILETMTVREALLFAAQLRLPAHMPAAEKEQRALAVADMLNLTKALNNYVGSSLLKGIRYVLGSAKPTHNTTGARHAHHMLLGWDICLTCATCHPSWSIVVGGDMWAYAPRHCITLAVCDDDATILML